MSHFNLLGLTLDPAGKRVLVVDVSRDAVLVVDIASGQRVIL
ncbi:hypothetical protein [Haliangium sp.]